MNLVKPSAFIFDCDGTLVDSMGAWVALWPEVAAEYGQDRAAEDFDPFEHLSMEQEAAAVHERMGIAPSASELLARVRELISRSYREDVRPRPGVPAFLKAARDAGIPMAVATSTSKDLVQMTLESNGIDGFFRGIVTTGMVGASKQEPDVYDGALELACPGAARSSAWVFEDAMFGLKAAGGAGYRTVGIYDPAGHADRDVVHGLADIAVDSFEALTLDDVLTWTA